MAQKCVQADPEDELPVQSKRKTAKSLHRNTEMAQKCVQADPEDELPVPVELPESAELPVQSKRKTAKSLHRNTEMAQKCVQADPEDELPVPVELPESAELPVQSKRKTAKSLHRNTEMAQKCVQADPEDELPVPVELPESAELPVQSKRKTAKSLHRNPHAELSESNDLSTHDISAAKQKSSKKLEKSKEDLTSMKHAKEMWDKSKPKRKFSYFDQKSIRKVTTKFIEGAAKSTDSSKFDNALFTDKSKYLQATFSFVLAKRQNNLLPLDHPKANGLITIEDYQSLQFGSASIDLINYICDYLIQPTTLNLTIFAEEILEGNVPFQFSIKEKSCCMPYFKSGYWNLLLFNTRKSNFCNISTQLEPDPLQQQSILDAFEKFITSYNSSRKSKLLPFDHWSSYNNLPIRKSILNPEESGILVLHYIYELSSTTKVEEFSSINFREALQKEVLMYSESMIDNCLICGQQNDNSTSSSISWTCCSTCERWTHDICIDTIDSTEEDYQCPLCNNANPSQSFYLNTKNSQKSTQADPADELTGPIELPKQSKRKTGKKKPKNAQKSIQSDPAVELPGSERKTGKSHDNLN